jgi:hypothetical protein
MLGLAELVEAFDAELMRAAIFDYPKRKLSLPAP